MSTRDDDDVTAEEIGLPKAGEKLFAKGSGDWRLNAYVRSQWPEEAAWDRYIEGYKIAARAVLDRVVEDYRERDKVVFPIVFLHRHQIELCLKAIIVFGNGLFDSSFKFPGHHDLTGLWLMVRPLLERRWQKHAVYDIVDAQLKELARFDGGSFAYRYPVKTDGQTSSHPDRHPNDPSRPFDQINIEHFCDVAGRLSEFLHGCAYGLWCELDEKDQAQADALEWYGSMAGE